MLKHKLIQTTWLALLCCTAAGAAAAREIPSASPARHGFSAERLQKLSTHMAARVADGTMIGGMGLVARDGKVIYRQSYGLADRESGRVMADDAIFRIYSMTKPVTSVAVMMLYEDGKLLLDDPVAKYLPALANLQVATATAGAAGTVSDGIVSRPEQPETGPQSTAGQDANDGMGPQRAALRQPTVRDLLTHTAGFTYGVFGLTEVDVAYRKAELLAPHLSLEEFVQRLGGLPLQYDPGSRWHYSVSVDIQGRLVEAVSGMSFAQFLQERIFTPLDMRDTGFFIDPARQHRLAQIYVPEGIGEFGFLERPTGSALEVAPPLVDAGFQPDARFVSGGGGLLSTARDYLRFSQALLNGGQLDGVRILSPTTVALMTANHLGPITPSLNRPGVGFGLGFAVVLDPGTAGEVGSVGEYSWGGAAGTRFWVDPAENMIGLFMVQSIPHHTNLARQFKALVYQALVDSRG